METADVRRRAGENPTEIVSTLVTGVWLAALFTGQEWWLAAMLVGYVVVVPIVSLLFGDEDEASEGESAESDDGRHTADRDGDRTDDALERLRERYAAGELTDEQFERKLERLLETETLEDVEDRRADPTSGRDSPRSNRGSDDDVAEESDADRDEEYEFSR